MPDKEVGEKDKDPYWMPEHPVGPQPLISSSPRDKRQSASSGGNRTSIWRIALMGAGVVIILLVSGVIALDQYLKGVVKRIACHNNLCNIATGLNGYAEDHTGLYPLGLEMLYNKYILDTSYFVCPSSTKMKAENVTPTDYDLKKPANIPSRSISYCYVAGLMSSDPPNYILVFDEETNHKRRGILVVFIGQEMMWQKDVSTIRAQLKKQQQELKAQGREMRVICPAR